MFAMTSAGGAEFIQDGGFFLCGLLSCIANGPFRDILSWIVDSYFPLLEKAMFGNIEL